MEKHPQQNENGLGKEGERERGRSLPLSSVCTRRPHRAHTRTLKPPEMIPWLACSPLQGVAKKKRRHLDLVLQQRCWHASGNITLSRKQMFPLKLSQQLVNPPGAGRLEV